MKVVLLHGPAKTASRDKLLEIKNKFDKNNVLVFEEGADFRDIKDNLAAVSLFSEERLIILENPCEDFTNCQLPASRGEPTTNYQLILWFDHEIEKNNPFLEYVRKLDGQILYFAEEKEMTVFPFLDFLAEGNVKAFLEMDKLKAAGYDIYYLITMVFYLLRNLVNTPKNVPKFVQDKLQRQKKNFNLQKVINLYMAVLGLDFKLKSGLIEAKQAEFELVNNFMERAAH